MRFPLYYLIIGVTSLLCSFKAFAQQRSQEKAEGLVILNVNVISMKSEKILNNQAVVIKDGIISAILPSKKYQPKPETVQIDGKNQYLIPGLIDVHVHFTLEDNNVNSKMAQVLLSYGITTALGLRGRDIQLALRDSIRRGELPGPRLLISTRNVNNADYTEEDGRQLVKTAKQDGFDFIKVYEKLSARGLSGILDEAKKINIPVTGHIPKSAGLYFALDAGLKRIAHVEELLYTEPFNFRFNNDSVSVKALNADSIPVLIDKLKRYGVMLSPTLVAYETIIYASRNPGELKKQAELFAPAIGAAGEWAPFADGKFYANKFNNSQWAQLDAALDFQRRIVLAAFKAGVPIVAGTDSPMFGYQQAGLALIKELEDYEGIGIPLYDVIKTATLNAAQYLALEDSIGTIEVGKSADFVLLKTNPLKNISTLLDPLAVMISGRWYNREELIKMRNPH